MEKREFYEIRKALEKCEACKKCVGSACFEYEFRVKCELLTLNLRRNRL